MTAIPFFLPRAVCCECFSTEIVAKLILNNECTLPQTFQKKKYNNNPSPVPSVKKAGINLIMNGFKK